MSHLFPSHFAVLSSLHAAWPDSASSVAPSMRPISGEPGLQLGERQCVDRQVDEGRDAAHQPAIGILEGRALLLVACP